MDESDDDEGTTQLLSD